MGFLDKAKAAAEQAAARAKEGVEDLQTRYDLGQAYDELGKVTFELIESGEVEHASLEAPADRIRELRRRAAGGDEADPEAETDDEAGPESPLPPPAAQP